jgi:hypothetical protein
MQSRRRGDAKEDAEKALLNDEWSSTRGESNVVTFHSSITGTSSASVSASPCLRGCIAVIVTVRASVP